MGDSETRSFEPLLVIHGQMAEGSVVNLMMCCFLDPVVLGTTKATCVVLKAHVVLWIELSFLCMQILCPQLLTNLADPKVIPISGKE